MSNAQKSPSDHPYVQKLKAAALDPKNKAAWQRANAALVAKALTPGVVHIDSALTNLSIQYANGDYIGTRLMPVVPVARLSDRYFIYDKRSRLAYPDDAMGARSSPNELNENLTTANFSCQSFGYKEYLDNLTLKNQDAPLDEMVDLIANLNEGLAFREELRIASILTTPANFGANTAAVAALWSGAGTPVSDIKTAVRALWTGRGPGKVVGYCNNDVWDAMIQNASLRGYFQYVVAGMTPTEAVAKLVGLDDILVCSARKDTANEAQAAAYGRLWPNGFGIVRVAEGANIRNASFGYTFRFGGKPTDQWYDPSLGPMGGYYGRVSVTECHTVVAPDTGYWLQTVI